MPFLAGLEGALSEITKALSVRAPWWWAILHGKPVENRDWPLGFRGVIWLHAGKTWKPAEIEADWDDVQHMAAKDRLTLPDPNWAKIRAACGCIVGSVEIIGCVESHPSAFFVGRYGYVTAQPCSARNAGPIQGRIGPIQRTSRADRGCRMSLQNAVQQSVNLVPERGFMDNIDALLYMPASFVCDECGFHLEKRTLIAQTGQVGIKKGGEEPEPCPNDGGS